MNHNDTGTTVLDVRHLDMPGIIAACLLDTGAGPAIIDPGPQSCMEKLRAGMAEHGVSIGDLRSILLTHIHLDHAGATGSLVRENPKIQVHVHERGAPHLADPTRLLRSAERLYGTEMNTLWGEFLAVPELNLNSLSGGERLEFGTRQLEVAYTPGHASHHVSYFDPSAGVAFVGDCAGIRLEGESQVLLPTPPPDIDVEVWLETMDLIMTWNPEQLLITHFGAIDDPATQMAVAGERLQDWASKVKKTLAQDGSDDERAKRFTDDIATDLRTQTSHAAADRYLAGMGIEHCWSGLARYWRKREG